MSYYQHHVFFCCNQRDPPERCCATNDALEMQQYAKKRIKALGLSGKDRVRIIVEAFRPNYGGGFRSATAAELKPQLAAYDGYPLYLFDGPHYVTPALVKALAK